LGFGIVPQDSISLSYLHAHSYRQYKPKTKKIQIQTKAKDAGEGKTCRRADKNSISNDMGAGGVSLTITTASEITFLRVTVQLFR
jgi:hypothetical protein